MDRNLPVSNGRVRTALLLSSTMSQIPPTSWGDCTHAWPQLQYSKSKTAQTAHPLNTMNQANVGACHCHRIHSVPFWYPLIVLNLRGTKSSFNLFLVSLFRDAGKIVVKVVRCSHVMKIGCYSGLEPGAAHTVCDRNYHVTSDHLQPNRISQFIIISMVVCIYVWWPSKHFTLAKAQVWLRWLDCKDAT